MTELELQDYKVLEGFKAPLDLVAALAFQLNNFLEQRAGLLRIFALQVVAFVVGVLDRYFIVLALIILIFIAIIILFFIGAVVVLLGRTCFTGGARGASRLARAGGGRCGGRLVALVRARRRGAASWARGAK